MNIILKNLKLTAVFILTLTVLSCNDDDDTPVLTTNTIVDLAIANDLNSLAAALQATDLVTTLQGDGPFTVFAPTNEAFTTFLNDADIDLENMTQAQEDLVKNILNNHVIVGSELKSSDLIAAGSGYAKTNATGPGDNKLSIYYSTSNGVVLNGVSTVTSPDNEADNGVVHVVDAVIGLPTIATFATSNNALETLVTALDYAANNDPNVNPSYLSVVADATTGPFTVFAPVNDAFTNTETGVLAELQLTGFGEGQGQLNGVITNAVLEMHIVNANVTSSMLPNGDVTTLGEVILADNTAFTLTANGRVSNIVTTLVDIQAINGVVHVIDKVILPAL